MTFNTTCDRESAVAHGTALVGLASGGLLITFTCICITGRLRIWRDAPFFTLIMCQIVVDMLGLANALFDGITNIVGVMVPRSVSGRFVKFVFIECVYDTTFFLYLIIAAIRLKFVLSNTNITQSISPRTYIIGVAGVFVISLFSVLAVTSYFEATFVYNPICNVWTYEMNTPVYGMLALLIYIYGIAVSTCVAALVLYLVIYLYMRCSSRMENQQNTGAHRNFLIMGFVGVAGQVTWIAAVNIYPDRFMHFYCLNATVGSLALLLNSKIRGFVFKKVTGNKVAPLNGIKHIAVKSATTQF